MGQNSALFPTLLLVIALAAAEKDTTTAALDRVCRSLGGYYVTPGLCHSALCSDASDPCRAAHDDAAVAALAARLAARNATATQAVLSSAAASNATPSCLQLYAGAVPALRWAAASVAAGRYRGAREVVQAAQYVAAGCEGIMEGTAAAGALPPENARFSDMAFVSHAVLAYMARD
jgi:pectinesterase inhibitor-like protein